MIKINQRYIDESNRIREKYLITLDDISKREIEILKYKNEIEILMEKNTKYISDNDKKDVEQIKEDLKEELLEIDSNINKIVSKLEPYFKSIEKLKKESQELFISIKEKYPELTEQNIQEQIFMSIKK